jgi:general secretion pathway protein G
MDRPRHPRSAFHVPWRHGSLTGDEKGDGGWTFIETLVVVAIILVLTSAVGFVAVRWIASANRAATRTQIDTYGVALAAYFADTGAYPTAEQGLPALWEKPVIEPADRKSVV